MLTLFTGWCERRQQSGAGALPAKEASKDSASSIGGTASRKQLLAVVLKETLLRNGVPSAWLGMEFFRTVDRTGARTDGIHVRLAVRDGHHDLPACMVALERDFRRRVALIDYRAPEWLQGVSWQFDLPDDLPPAPPLGAARPTPPAHVPGSDSTAETGGIENGEGVGQQDFRERTYALTAAAPL